MAHSFLGDLRWQLEGKNFLSSMRIISTREIPLAASTCPMFDFVNSIINEHGDGLGYNTAKIAAKKDHSCTPIAIL
jgi:hypothetical protein